MMMMLLIIWMTTTKSDVMVVKCVACDICCMSIAVVSRPSITFQEIVFFLQGNRDESDKVDKSLAKTDAEALIQVREYHNLSMCHGSVCFHDS
jgi:hypothetical protein